MQLHLGTVTLAAPEQCLPQKLGNYIHKLSLMKQCWRIVLGLCDVYFFFIYSWSVYALLIFFLLFLMGSFKLSFDVCLHADINGPLSVRSLMNFAISVHSLKFVLHCVCLEP